MKPTVKKKKTFKEKNTTKEIKNKKTVRVSSTEIGGTGTPIFSGIISMEEYNPNLAGRDGLIVYDEMRRSDATVGAAMMAVKLPILGAKWFFQPADESDENKEIADFVEENFMTHCETTWQDFIRQALLMLDFGYMVFEKVFQIINYNGKDYIGLKKLAPRLPKTIYRWQMADGKDGVTQILPQGGQPEIPLEKLLVFTNNKEGDNFNGMSLLRQAYKHWYFKNAFYKIDALSFERQGLGIPIAKMPPNYDPADKAMIEELLRNMRANEEAYLMIPNGWEFEFADMKARTVRDPKESILHHDRSIMKSVLAQFLELGASSGSGTGSHALASDHSDLFFEAEKAVARHICDIINHHAVKQLVDMNFDVAQYPKLTFAKIGKIDYVAYSTCLKNLTDSGLLTGDRSLEEYLREQLELPDLLDVLEETEDNQNDDGDTNNTPKNQVEVDKNIKEEDTTDDEKAKTPNWQKNNTGNTDQKKARQASEAKKKNPVQLSGDEFTSWRPLTFAEKKVNFSLIQQRITEIEDRFKISAKKFLNKQAKEMVDDFKKHINNKDTDKIHNLSMPDKDEYRQLILKYLKIPYEFGKRSCSSEMKTPSPATPQSEIDRIQMQSDTISNIHEGDMLKTMKLTAINGLRKIKASEMKFADVKKKKPSPVTDTATAVTIDDVMDLSLDDMEEEIGTFVDDTAVITTGMLYNQGRSLAQRENSPNIYALQRSEILDDVVCDFCMSMDGVIVALDDPAADEDEYHSNCRGIWVEIMNDEEELPEITGVPEELQGYYGGSVNDLKQPPRPIIRDGSLAQEYLQK